MGNTWWLMIDVRISPHSSSIMWSHVKENKYVGMKSLVNFFLGYYPYEKQALTKGWLINGWFKRKQFYWEEILSKYFFWVIIHTGNTRWLEMIDVQITPHSFFIMWNLAEENIHIGSKSLVKHFFWDILHMGNKRWPGDDW